MEHATQSHFRVTDIPHQTRLSLAEKLILFSAVLFIASGIFVYNFKASVFERALQTMHLGRVQTWVTQHIYLQQNPNQASKEDLYPSDIVLAVDSRSRKKSESRKDEMGSIAARLSQYKSGSKQVIYEYPTDTNRNLCIVHENGKACLALQPGTQVVNPSNVASDDMMAPSILN